MKKIIIAIISIAAIALLAYKAKTLLNERQDAVANTPLPREAPITVRVAKATKGSIKNELSLLAQVVPKKSINISSKLAGYITTIAVEDAQLITKGEFLLKIDSQEIDSNIEALKSAQNTQISDLALSKKIDSRNQKIYDIGGISKEKLELSKLSLQAKKATLDNTTQKISQLENQLTYLEIKAPFDGQVDSLMLHEGDLAVAGKPIISISTIEQKLLISYVKSPRNNLKIDDKVYLNGIEIGKIKLLYPNSTNGVNLAEVSLYKVLNISSGKSITIQVLTKNISGCTVPNESIIHSKEASYLMQYSDAKFSKTAINIDASDSRHSIVIPCPKYPVAVANENVLSSLAAYTNIKVTGETDAQ